MALTPNQRAVLLALDDTPEETPYLAFDGIARRGRIERKLVRRTVRDLARKGYASFAKGLWSDDGTPFGSGYRITDAGREALTTSGGN